MKITKIERQKKDNSRLSVFLDGKFAFGISEADARNLCEGAELDSETYAEIMSELVIKRANFLALRYLSYSDRTEKEVCEKLRSYGEFSEDVISQAVSAIKELGYIDDEKYAALYAQSKSRRLDGPKKIERALILKGISPKTANEAVSSLETDEAENAARLIRKKSKGRLDYSQKQKLFGYLTRKGYPVSVIYEAFKLAENEIEYEWE